jgi:pimeloyl-ACP methyl ester carboxylesterase
VEEPFDVVGAGVPVVLHCGAAGDSRMWREAGYVEGLVDFQVVLFDPRGHGQSDAPSDPRRHTVGDYVEDVLAVADELGFDRFAFWGHSDGGRVGYQLAATAPGRVIALVAAGGVDPPGEDPSEWFEAAGLVREHGIGAILGEERMPAWAVRQVVEEMDREVVARELECFANWQLWPLLAGIQAATLLVAGELESEHLADAAAGLQNGWAVVIPNVGHIGAFLRSDLVLPHVVPFLRSVTSA